MSLENDLRDILNKYGRESNSNTPDFILSQYIYGCLISFETAIQQRETWYGRDARPAEVKAPVS